MVNNKVCSECGAPIPQGSAFCQNCGAQQVQRKHKNVALATVLSFILPGVGQMYIGKWGLGIILLVIDIGQYALLGQNILSEIIGLIIAIVAAVYAYRGAKDYNTKVGYPE